VTYTESNEDFPNPERGFYRYSEVHRPATNTVLDVNELKGYRRLQAIPIGNLPGGTVRWCSGIIL
jgi:hypothetical protein